MLAFDAETHVYMVNGRAVPSVTQLLERHGLVNTEWFTDEARARGTAVHAAIHYLDEGTLDWDSVDPRIKGYLCAYERFVYETQFESYISERPLASAKYHYAGTLDRLGWLHKLLTLIDFKSGKHVAANEIQLEFYRRLCIENHDELGLSPNEHIGMQIVELREDGKYKLPPAIIQPHRLQAITNSILTLNLFRKEMEAA